MCKSSNLRILEILTVELSELDRVEELELSQLLFAI